MVEYVLTEDNTLLFDPAVGTGAFFHAAKSIAQEKGLRVRFTGVEIDSDALMLSLEHGLLPEDIAEVTIGDFFSYSPERQFKAITANPPYIRHHLIDPEKKTTLQRFASQILGKKLDGRAGLHIYFLIRALSLLGEDGKLAIIVPADTCEGKFAPALWEWITTHFVLDAVITFSPQATPFQDVDVNPIILLIRKSAPAKQTHFLWVQCNQSKTDALKAWVRSGFKDNSTDALFVAVRSLKEGLTTGLSRRPTAYIKTTYRLGDFVKVMRGIATGNNDFFLMTSEKAKQLGIPESFFVRAIARTRDVPAEEITYETIAWLEHQGRPTMLLSLGKENLDVLPHSVRRYIEQGEKLGLHKRPLLAKRRPWYKVETRIPPPFLFAYLGRRHSRFIRNKAKVVPLTGFLCVYPLNNNEEILDCLWRILTHPDTLANLSSNGGKHRSCACNPLADNALGIDRN